MFDLSWLDRWTSRKTGMESDEDMKKKRKQSGDGETTSSKVTKKK